MTDLPPAQWPPPATSEPQPTGRWQRWGSRPRWIRWSAYVLVGLLALSGLGALVGEPADESSEPVETLPPATIAVTSTAPESTSASTAAATTTTTVAPTSTTTISTTTTSTTTTTTPSTTVPGSLLALDVLATITVENERPEGYSRDLFSYGDTVDGQGCRTRALVLRRDSLTPAQVDPVGCAVVAGDWYSVYDGVTWSDPAELDIDHVVALKEAWGSGAWAWTPQRRSAFGNDLEDPRSLRAVTSSVNQSKGAADPSNWIPPNADFVCTYLSDWVSIKARWSLSMDQSEHGRIRNLLTDRCPGQTIAPWPNTPAPGPPATAPSGAVDTPPLPATGNCDPSYPTVCISPSPPDLDCGEIMHRRFTVLAPDPHRFDGDRNGIGCES
jgi:hypothetical protein